MDEITFINENYPLYKNGTSNREIRHDFFSKIETELQAYLLGFIYADGSINIQRHTLSIHINDVDGELFDLFKIISPKAYTSKDAGYESKALVRGRTVKNKSSIRLAISSKILINDLIQLGVCERKTYEELHIPKMPYNLIGHFIRGYFDGDGSFTWIATAPNLSNREKNWRIKMTWRIDSKTKTILTEFQQWFCENNIKLNINYTKRDDMYVICTSSKKTFSNLYELIHKNAKYSLSRKANKINHYVNTEVTQLIAEYRNAQEVNANESNNPPKSSERPTLLDENIC